MTSFKDEAKYTSYRALDHDNYNVSTQPVPDYNDPSAVNTTGVVNKYGEQVVSEQYFTYIMTDFVCTESVL